MIYHANANHYRIAFYDVFQGLSSFFESNPKKVNFRGVPPVFADRFHYFCR
jgi:hypothetical protein